MTMRMVLLILLFWTETISAAGIVRCVDSDTGAVTFTERACSQGQGERVRLHGGNVMDSGHLRSEMQRQEAERQAEEAHYRERQASVQQQASVQRTSPEKERACREAARPHKGSQGGLTAAQLDVLAWCGGAPRSNSRSKDSHAPTAIPAPAHTPPPTSMSCDATGCWDNQGGRYNKGAGPTHIRQDGRVCQLIGGQMQCP